MNRFARTMEDLRLRFTIWWTAHVDAPGCTLGEEHMRRKDSALEWMFLGNPIGRIVFRIMSANAWTWTRLVCSPIPMVLIITDRILLACVSFVLIGLTDLFDGWFARRKNQVTEWGEWFETRVDWVFLLLSFIGVFVRYRDMRPFMLVAGALEIVRAIGGKHLRESRFTPHPNQSGKWKMPFFVGGIGLRFIHDLVTDFASVPPLATGIVVLCCYACVTTGIALSFYSLFMHLCDFRAWKRQQR